LCIPAQLPPLTEKNGLAFEKGSQKIIQEPESSEYKKPTIATLAFYLKINYLITVSRPIFVDLRLA